MSDTGIARVYATALFEAATAAGTRRAHRRATCASFVAALDESPALADVVFNPQIEPESQDCGWSSSSRGDADRLAAGVLRVHARERAASRSSARSPTSTSASSPRRPG